MKSVRRSALLLCAAATATTVLAAVAASPTQAAPRRPAPAAQQTTRQAGASTLGWHTCQNSGLRAAGLQCATLAVPLDYAHPRGRTIKLALTRLKHTSSDYQGVVLTNPGGPGGSGRGLATIGRAIPNGVGADYDWIGFDPRGVGASQPHISCDNTYFGFDRPNYAPTAKDVRVWKKRARDYAQACARKNGAILGHLTTIDSARDMDSIRKALGVDRINYYGYSYGTYLGQVYATLFPTHVRRMVLDSNVNAHRIWYAANLDQDRAFNRNLNIWFGWLARHHATYHLGRTKQAVHHLWYSIRAKLAAKPDGKIGPDEWTDTFIQAGYYQLTWLDQARVFAGYVHHHDVAALVRAYKDADGYGNDNNYAVYLGVQCSDIQWPRKWSTWLADNTRVSKGSPFETWANAWYNAPCLYWPAKAHKPVTVDGKGVAPILLVDQTLDAATPYHGSIVTRSLFPKSRLIAEPGGTSHAVTMSARNNCVDDKIAAYLRDGTLPARKSGNRADATCKPLPEPTP